MPCPLNGVQCKLNTSQKFIPNNGGIDGGRDIGGMTPQIDGCQPQRFANTKAKGQEGIEVNIAWNVIVMNGFWGDE